MGLSRTEIGLVLSLALLVRALCFLAAASHPERFFTTDSVGYMALARDLSAGYLDPESPNFVLGLVRTPAYPIFLGALLTLSGGSTHAIVLAQIGLSLATLWLTCTLAVRLVGRRPALIAGVILALDPASALFPCLLQPETLFTMLLVGATLLLHIAVAGRSARTALGSGALLGLAALTRPLGIFLPLWLAPAVWTATKGPRRGRLLIAFLAAAGTPMGAWMAKNQVLTGFPVFSIAGDSSLLHYRAAGALAESEGLTLEKARAVLQGRLLAMQPPARSVAELSSRQRALALSTFAEHPLGTVKMTLRGFSLMVTGTGLSALSNLVAGPDLGTIPKPWVFVLQTVATAVILIACLSVARGAVRLAAEGNHAALMLTLGVIAYLVLLSAGPEAGSRFRLPAMPFLAILAGHGMPRVSLGRVPWGAP